MATYFDDGVSERETLEVGGVEVFLALRFDLVAFDGDLFTNTSLIFRVVGQFVHDPSEGACGSLVSGKKKGAVYGSVE